MLEELERKAKKAIRWKTKIWTIEEIRYAKAKAKIWSDILNAHYNFLNVLNNLIVKKQKENI